MEITTIGLDLAKQVFQVHGVDASGEVVVRRRLRRGAVRRPAGARGEDDVVRGPGLL